jgi:hypothetical protein
VSRALALSTAILMAAGFLNGSTAFAYVALGATVLLLGWGFWLDRSG